MRRKLLLGLAIIGLIVLCIPAVDAQNAFLCPLPTLSSGLETPPPSIRKPIEGDQTVEWFVARCNTQQTEYVFEGQADSVYTVLLKGAQDSIGTPCITLVSADGSLIGTGTPIVSNDRTPTLTISYALLPTSGQYRIISMPCNNSSGFFTIQLISTIIQPVKFNTVVQGTFDPVQQSIGFGFEGQAGDEIYVQFDPQDSQITVELFCIPRADCGNPTGSIPINFRGGLYNTPIQLPLTGKYLITVRAPMSSIQLSINRLEPVAIQYGDKVDVEFDTDTSLHAFRFVGHIADMVQIHVESDDKIDTELSLIQNAAVLASDDDSGRNYDPEILNWPLTMDDDYLIIIQPLQFNNTGHVTLMLSSSHIDLDEKPQLVTLGLKQKYAGMAFTGKAGEHIEIKVLNLTNNANAPQISVSQNGKVIAEAHQTGGSGSGLIFVLPEDGKVSVMISIMNPTQSTLEVSVKHLDGS